VRETCLSQLQDNYIQLRNIETCIPILNKNQINNTAKDVLAVDLCVI